MLLSAVKVVEDILKRMDHKHLQVFDKLHLPISKTFNIYEYHFFI